MHAWYMIQHRFYWLQSYLVHCKQMLHYMFSASYQDQYFHFLTWPRDNIFYFQNCWWKTFPWWPFIPVGLNQNTSTIFRRRWQISAYHIADDLVSYFLAMKKSSSAMCEIIDIKLQANKPHFQDNKYSLSPCYNFLETFGEVIWMIDTSVKINYQAIYTIRLPTFQPPLPKLKQYIYLHIHILGHELITLYIYNIKSRKYANNSRDKHSIKNLWWQNGISSFTLVGSETRARNTMFPRVSSTHAVMKIMTAKKPTCVSADLYFFWIINVNVEHLGPILKDSQQFFLLLTFRSLPPFLRQTIIWPRQV